MVTFNLPKFHKKRITEKNQTLFPGEKFGIYSCIYKEFDNYKLTVEELFMDANIKSHIIKHYEDVEYCESIRG